MPPLDYISVAVLCGIILLGASLVPVVRLLQITRSRQLRRAWMCLAIMIVGFIVGYVALIGLLPRDTNQMLTRLICTVLAMGGLFVLSVAILALRTAADVARLVHLEQEVIIDPLTGVYNRRFFEDQFARSVALANRAGTQVSLMVIDLDHFKAVNDTYGHAAGDRVLAVVAAMLSEGIRNSDILVRYGGEEFVVIAPAAGKDAVALLATRLCQKVADAQISCPGVTKIAVTISVGYATLREDERAETLFLRADAAVFEAKRNGRNRAVSGDLENTQPDDRTNAA